MLTTCSRLLKSCAMPPVSRPIASIFCTWVSAAWARSRSLISFISRSLALASSRVRSRMRLSSSPLSRSSSWRVRLNSCRCSRAAYCRRRARTADSAALASVSALSGRSSSTRLPRLCSLRKSLSGRRPSRLVASTTKGKSDQGGWSRSQASNSSLAIRSGRASSVTTTLAAPSTSAASNLPGSAQTSDSIPCCASTPCTTAASRPRGAWTRTRSSITQARSSARPAAGRRRGRPSRPSAPPGSRSAPGPPRCRPGPCGTRGSSARARWCGS